QMQLVGQAQTEKKLRAFYSEWNGKKITMSMFLESSGGDRGLAATAARLTAQAVAYQNNYQGGLYSGGVKEFASGGFMSGVYPYTPGGIHKFAEKGDEAYISFLPQYRQRNVGVWLESGARLGVMPPVSTPQPQAPQGPTRIEGTLDL